MDSRNLVALALFCRQQPNISRDHVTCIDNVSWHQTGYRHFLSRSTPARNCILCLKPALRLERRGQDSQEEIEQREHSPLTLSDSVSQTMRIRFSVHTPIIKRQRNDAAVCQSNCRLGLGKFYLLTFCWRARDNCSHALDWMGVDGALASLAACLRV